MNRLYLVSNDGRIFFAESASCYFEPLNADENNDVAIRVKKLSSCDWCIWTISSTFKVYLYVFKSDTPIEHLEVTYENQRRYNLLSCTSFSDKLFPTDRPHFSCRDGTVELKKENFRLPSDAWLWENDWTFEQTISDGWEYAVDFPANYFSKFFPTAFVRRKKWLRNRIFESYNRFIKINSPKDNDCMIDISIGGWAIPYCNKGYLSVWAISNTGKLFFRKDVSYSNLEGKEWEAVYLPRRAGVFSCSCSSSGDLWVITYDGQVLMRTGVSRDEPSGNGWLEISASNGIDSIFRQLSIGKSSIWSLDNLGHVFYRAGISENKPEGTKWVHIPANMSNISVSSSDQLWAIDSDEMSLNFRCGIDEENTSGTGWKKVILKCKPANNNNKNFDLNDNDILKPEEIAEIMRDVEVYNEKFEKEQNEMLTSKNTAETEKVFGESITYIEDSIYDDSIYETSNNNNDDTSKLFSRFEFEIKPANVNEKEINLDRLVRANNYENVSGTLNETTRNFDDFMQKIKQEESNDEKSDDVEIFSNSMNSSSQLFTRDHSSSVISETSSMGSFGDERRASMSQAGDRLSVHSMPDSIGANTDLNLLGFKICHASNFLLDSNSIPSNWFDSSADLADDLEVEENFYKKSEWRNNLLNDLKKRNIKETYNIDKISIPYENSTWSRKETFSFWRGSKIYECSVEIVTEHGRNQNAKSFQARIVIRPLKKTKWKIELDFKEILSVTRWVLEKKPTTPCFALFVVKQTSPLIFLSSSENKLDDWLSQMAIYCSKLSGLTSTLAAITMTNTDGSAYFAYIRQSQPLLFKQIDGHFKMVEKHFTGLTFGLGENGKLWVLSIPHYVSLDCYKGPYLQTDEIEIHTYENQRWNAISGIIGSLNGYTDIGFLTDRYNWSDESGKIRRRKEDCTLPSSLFSWSTPWQVDFSTPGGVDKDGWQYAFDFPASYHAVRVPLTDFVRRRRWMRRCRSKVNTLWREVIQGHRLTSFAMDQELSYARQLPERSVLCWATDTEGFVLCSLITETSPANLKWQHVFSHESFKYVSIGPNLRVWGVDVNGLLYIRYGVDKKTNFCGSSWTLIESPANSHLRFVNVSVGNDCVWSVSNENELYFRENVSRSFPEGTEWVKVSSKIKYVTVNSSNQVYAVSAEDSKKPNVLLFRDGVTPKNLMGTRWMEVIQMKAKMISNRGNLF